MKIALGITTLIWIILLGQLRANPIFRSDGVDFSGTRVVVSGRANIRIVSTSVFIRGFPSSLSLEQARLIYKKELEKLKKEIGETNNATLDVGMAFLIKLNISFVDIHGGKNRLNEKELDV